MELLITIPKLKNLHELSLRCGDGYENFKWSSLIDYYVFCEKNTLKKVYISLSEGMTLNSPIKQNYILNDLRISVQTLDDLYRIFEILPNITRLRVNVATHNASQLIPLQAHYPKCLNAFHIETYDTQVMLFDDMQCLLRNLPTITHFSLEIHTCDKYYLDGNSWESMLSTCLPQISQFYMMIRYHDNNFIDVNAVLEKFSTEFWLNEKKWFVACYMSNTIVYLDTVPHVLLNKCDVLETTIHMSNLKSTGGCVQSKYVQEISIDGHHEHFSMTEWFQIINQFPFIRKLDLSSINTFGFASLSVKFSHLVSLHHLGIYRSYQNRTNINFFTHMIKMMPKLKRLSIYYTELIYLTKQLNDAENLCCGIEYLDIISTAKIDGQIIAADIDKVSSLFRNIKHLKFHLTSIRVMKPKYRETLLIKMLNDFSNLISFNMICSKTNLKFHFLESGQLNKWLKTNVDKLMNNEEALYTSYSKTCFQLWF
ncbi:unnamed protein product [Didymodactylos carnosus]|uniref:Uncharacterized protein n=1 Tax=Didymodactylos carnosus TaxID=1234261 RepID=A0A814H207_9BILA|nr:unnamed protein product [Didymodactylos carnosus]CAF3775111.1 unnamed protein product [Didymodactylos carnosus]